MKGRHPATRRGVGRGSGPEVGTQLEAGGRDGRGPREHVQALRDRGTGAGSCVGRRLKAVSKGLHFLLHAASTLLELGGFHGGGTASGAFTRLGVRVDHPPGRLTGTLILHAHEAVVEREVVANRVLQQNDKPGLT